MTRASLILALALVLAPLTGRAEKLYVTDVLAIVLRAAPGADGPAVKTLTSGAELEILERNAGYARVRDAQGATGWAEARFLVPEPPARLQLERLKTQLAQESARAAELEKKLAQLPAAPPGAEEPANTAARSPASPAGMDGAVSGLVWLAVAFAMLVTGFVAGLLWLRERNRRKLGGMYLNIQDI